MLNLKKGLALVLAAATAFTFAPVANLGVTAQAAAGDILDYGKSEVNIQEGETRFIKLADLTKKDWITLQADHIDVSIPNNNTAAFLIAKDNNSTATDGSATTAQIPIKDQTVDTSVADRLIITGLHAGTTTISLKAKNSSGHQIAEEDLTVIVSAKVSNIQFKDDKLEFTKLEDNGSPADYYYEDKTHAAAGVAQGVTLINEKSGATGYKWTATTSNDKVVTVNGNSGNLATGSTNAKGVWESSNPSLFNVVPQGVGTATIDVTIKYTDSNSKDHYLTSASFTVVITDGTDTLKVSYDPSRTGKQQDAKLTTIPGQTNLSSYGNAFASGSQTNWIQENYYETESVGGSNVLSFAQAVGTTLYLDTVSNKTAKLDISDAAGRTYTVQSTNSWIAVDNSGNVTVSDPATGAYGGQDSYYGYVTVTVPKTEVGGKILASLQIVVPVQVYNKDTTSLEVREAGTDKFLGKTVGGVSGDFTSYDDLPVVYLSTKDKKSTTLSFNTNAGAQYITGVARDDSFNKLSDVVTYSNGTLTAVKAGRAIVQVVCRNSASTYSDATVYFAVEVVTKSANNVITTTSDSYQLTKSNPSANIGAKANYGSLKYSLVKEKDSTDEIKSSDITVDANGNLSYSGTNQGSVVVRISGTETVEALAPADKYVTVNYSNTKAASTLSVSDKEISLKPGDSQKIVASGSALAYKSSNEDVATVAQDGTVTAIKDGAAVITVTSPEDAEHMAGQAFVTVLVSQTGDITATPEKVSGLKVSNKKGAYVSVKWTSQGKNINYRVWKKVGNGKWIGKNVAGNKATLSVKKGAKVQVKVKSYVKDASGKTTWGPAATKAKTFKTDKK